MNRPALPLAPISANPDGLPATRWVGVVALALAVALSTGCAVFTNYNHTMAPARAAFASNRPDVARADITRQMKGADGSQETSLNPILERSIVEHSAGQFDASSKDLLRAADLVKADESKAVISASAVAAGAATMIVNEKAQPYMGEPFEKILIHTYLALDFLMRNDLEGAGVEARRSWERQEEVEKAHESQLAEARKDAAGQKVNDGAIEQEVDKAYADQAPVMSRVANAYQNAFTHFVAAVICNANGNSNDAYLELKRAHALRPGAPCLGPILIETAKVGGFQEDVAKWEKAYNLRAADVLAEAKRSPAELVVVFENGWAPLKEQISIPIPTPMGIVLIAIPKFVPQPGAAGTLMVAAGGAETATFVLGDVEAQAVRALHDRMVTYVIKMIVRVTARAVAERVAQKKAEEQFGTAGLVGAFVASSAVNIALEQADLRSWSLLPRDLEAARLRLPAGPAQVTLRLDGPSAASRTLSLNLRADRPNVVVVRAVGPVMYVQTNAGQ